MAKKYEGITIANRGFIPITELNNKDMITTLTCSCRQHDMAYDQFRIYERKKRHVIFECTECGTMLKIHLEEK